jgi:hypothetical protein
MMWVFIICPWILVVIFGVRIADLARKNSHLHLVIDDLDDENEKLIKKLMSKKEAP